MRRLLYAITVCAACVCIEGCSVIDQLFKPDSHKSDISATELKEGLSIDGTLEEVFHKTSVKGPSQRRLMVYLPADYYTSGKRYPVVYLLHGARGNETSWIVYGGMMGRVDSLTRMGMIEPAIYVMTNTNSYTTEEQGRTSAYKPLLKALMTTDGAVETGFMKDVVEFVDSNYKTIADKDHRAIAGLSIGSFQASYLSAHYPDSFGYVGLFSPIFKSPVKKTGYEEFYNKKDYAKLQNIQFSEAKAPKVYALMIGRSDVYFNHAENKHLNMAAKGYDHTFVVTPGRHDWPNWIDYLEKFLPMCFK